MRAIFTSLPAMGHLNSMMPLAVATRDAGHAVAVCSSPVFAAEVVRFGLQHLPGGADSLDEFLAPGVPHTGPLRTEWMRREVFARAAPNRLLPELAAHVAAWRPDVIVRESSEFAGCVLAEKLGLPHVAVATGALSARDDHREHFAESLSALRQQHGLSPDPEAAMMSRYLGFSLMPPSWDGDARIPITLHFVRYENPDRTGEELPAYLRHPRDRPMILAALGTLFNGVPGLFEVIFEALGHLPVDVVAAIGRDQDLKRFGTIPRNVRIEPWVPQIKVLGRAALFVTHGGFNSAKEALSQGVPLVVIPIGADQPYTAERVEALGLGRSVGAEERQAEIIRARAREVLEDPTYRADAEQFASEMASLPPLSEAVRLVERLARDRTPIVRDA